MSPIVLVHGAWHGAWCWDSLVASLQARSMRVSAPNLPGAGADTTPLAQIGLNDYAEAVVAAIRCFDEPVLLVGHSFGGMAITAAAELAPDRVARMVYLSAHLPGDGDSTLDLLGWLASDGRTDHPLTVVAGGAGLMIDADTARRFYTDVSDADIARCDRLRSAIPAAVAAAAVTVSASRAGRVSRTYIVCTRDEALHPDRQRRLVERAGAIETLDLAGGHFTFMSNPEPVAEMLVELASR